MALKSKRSEGKTNGGESHQVDLVLVRPRPAFVEKESATAFHVSADSVAWSVKKKKARYKVVHQKGAGKKKV